MHVIVVFDENDTDKIIAVIGPLASRAEAINVAKPLHQEYEIRPLVGIYDVYKAIK